MFQDLITTGNVPYSTFVRAYDPSLPQSESQTSLHSASQFAINHRSSTILNVSVPRYSATYGNPYLQSPHTPQQYSTFSPMDYKASTANRNSLSLISSAAIPITANSTVSIPRSSLNNPPVSGGEANNIPSVPLIAHNEHNSGSIVGIVPGACSGSPQHNPRNPTSNDLYAVVSKPGAISLTNNLQPVSVGVTSTPNSNIDTRSITKLKENSKSPVNYILDSNPSICNTGTHV